MNNKNNQGEYIKSHILDVSEKFENRLPCSSEEKNAAYAFSDQIKNETEVLPIIETFKTNLKNANYGSMVQQGIAFAGNLINAYKQPVAN